MLGLRYSRRTINILRHSNFQLKVNQVKMSTKSSNIAVVLSGCGVYDGTEVTEAASTLVHLSREGAKVSIFAPNVKQMHVIDHTQGTPMAGERNVLVEAARIARGKVSALDTLKVDEFDGIIFPGGFGVAKNLSNFATDGAKMTILPEVEKTLKDFKAKNKPIGLMCISSILSGRLFPGTEVTIGSDKEENGKFPHASAAGAITEMGGKHVKKSVQEAHVDMKNKIVSTPAFMCNTSECDVHDGIGEMVKKVLKMC